MKKDKKKLSMMNIGVSECAKHNISIKIENNNFSFNKSTFFEHIF